MDKLLQKAIQNFGLFFFFGFGEPLTFELPFGEVSSESHWIRMLQPIAPP